MNPFLTPANPIYGYFVVSSGAETRHLRVFRESSPPPALHVSPRIATLSSCITPRSGSFMNPRHAGRDCQCRRYRRSRQSLLRRCHETLHQGRRRQTGRCEFKTFGCAAAIATSSAATELVIGKSLEEAEKLTKDDVANLLGGLPPEKMSCSNLAPDAIRAAINDYRAKTGDRPYEGTALLTVPT